MRGATWPGGSHHVVSFGYAAGPVAGSMLVRAWILGRVGMNPAASPAPCRERWRTTSTGHPDRRSSISVSSAWMGCPGYSMCC